MGNQKRLIVQRRDQLRERRRLQACRHAAMCGQRGCAAEVPWRAAAAGAGAAVGAVHVRRLHRRCYDVIGISRDVCSRQAAQGLRRSVKAQDKRNILP